jgi:transcriptional regulator with XRE-family HTH domain
MSNGVAILKQQFPNVRGGDLPESTIDVGLLYSTLNRKREAQESSWRDLAKDLEISPSTFTRMAQGQRPDVDTFATLLRWLQMDVDKFTVSTTQQPASSDEPLLAVSSMLRSSKRLSPKDAEALDNIFAAAYKSIVKEEH